MKPRAMRKRAVLMELGSLGVSQKRAAMLLGLPAPSVSRYCKDLGVSLPREGGGWAPTVAKSRDRAASMLALYRAGYTLQQIGDQQGITRERVRQLMAKHFGVNHADGGAHVLAVKNEARRRTRRNDRCLRKYGCSWEQMAEVKKVSRAMKKAGRGFFSRPMGAFTSQRHNAGNRGIGFELTFWQWWCIWQESGHWAERGRGQGYVMCRRGDVGPYAVGNVFIAKAAENSAEGQNYKRLDPTLPMGVKRTKSGRYRAFRSLNGQKLHLGTHDTPELAHAAYLMAGEQMARAA